MPGRALDPDDAVRLYRSGLSANRVASILGASPTAVLNALRDRGERLRPGRRPCLFDRVVARDLYESGKSLRQIAVGFGVSQASVWAALVRLGVRMRPAVRRGARPIDDATLVSQTRRAERAGEESASRGEPVSACPFTDLTRAAAWRNGWSGRRDELRTQRDRELLAQLDPPEGRSRRIRRAAAREREPLFSPS